MYAIFFYFVSVLVLPVLPDVFLLAIRRALSNWYMAEKRNRIPKIASHAQNAIMILSPHALSFLSSYHFASMLSILSLSSITQLHPHHLFILFSSRSSIAQ
jgi:hypothetical protein